MQIIYNQIDSVSVPLDIYRNYLAFQEVKKNLHNILNQNLTYQRQPRSINDENRCFYRQILIKIVEKYMWRS